MSVQTQINRINGAVSEQGELIRQIKAALEGKAAGSGGDNNGLFATLTPNQAIVPEVANYVNDITMEGDAV